MYCLLGFSVYFIWNEKGETVKTKKLNEYAYVLDEQGRVDYVLVYVVSPKYGKLQMQIDVDDIHLLNDGPICVSYKYSTEKFYALQTVNGVKMQFHRRLFPDILPELEVMHGKSTLDNRRSQLKIGTVRQNQRDQKRHREGHLYGAHFHKKSGKYRARIKFKKVTVYLGTFLTAEEAHQAVLDYEKYLRSTLDIRSGL